MFFGAAPYASVPFGALDSVVRSASLSATLGGMSTASAGALRIAGTSAGTLGPATLEAFAFSSNERNAELDITFGGLSTTSSGKLPIAATGTATLGPVTSASSGTLPIVAAATGTLLGISLSSSGSLAIQAALTASLGELALSSRGTDPARFIEIPANRIASPTPDKPRSARPGMASLVSDRTAHPKPAGSRSAIPAEPSPLPDRTAAPTNKGLTLAERTASMATRFQGVLDTAEKLDFIAQMSDLLETGETITSAIVTLPAASSNAGLQVLGPSFTDDGVHPDPIAINSDTDVRFWLAVNPANVDDFAAGTWLDVKVTIATSETRTRERTFSVKVFSSL